MNLSEKEILNIGLSHCYFLRGTEKLLLSETFADLKSFTDSSLKDISMLIKRQVRPRAWQADDLLKFVERSIQYMGAYNINMASFNDGNFPPQLREIPDPPFSIFYRGELPDFNEPMIAMVGTRKPTGDGIEFALNFSKECGCKGVPVVSGLAFGIDAFSHRGCLEGGGRTVAVLACGPEQIYPRSNKGLAVKILETGGCVLSEYAPGVEALSYRFPERNRIISGLSRGVLVAEAPKKSGALITADFALEQGRDVFVSKKILDSLQNEGARKLFEDGAIAIDSVEELLNEWNNNGTGKTTVSSINKQQELSFN